MLDLLYQKPLLKNLAICMSCPLAASVLLYYLSESYIISQAEKNIQNLLISKSDLAAKIRQALDDRQG